MPIDFPNSPTNGDTYTVDSKTWSFNGTSWVLLQSDALLGNGSVTESKIADGAVTSAKIANGAVTAGKIASNAVSQAKLASNVSAVTITTSTNLATDVPSPFTGQMILETDTVKMKVWNGSSWVIITVAPPAAPTSLSAVPSSTSVAISFTPGADNGAYITNYEYAISTNGGSSYGAWTALSPADATSPITVSGLTQATAYYVKLRAVNATGPGTESSALSFTTVTTPNAPTSLSVSSADSTSITISFTAPTNDGGGAITNYEYSTNNGSTWTALSPADAVTPVTVTGLSSNTSYTIYLRAVNVAGSGTSSSSLSATTTPGAPTSLSAQSTTATTAVIGFVAPTGSATITNYEFSTNGSTWTALSPADAIPPVTITGLTSNTAYTVYLRAVNSSGSGTASSGLSITTNTNIQYLVIAGGGGGGNGGGGAGGYRTSASGQTSGGGASAESELPVALGTNYTVTVGGGGATSTGATGVESYGSNSVFASITSTGGGRGAQNGQFIGGNGGSGGGGYSTGTWTSKGTGTSGQGYDGANGGATPNGGGGGGAGSAGSGATGGNGVSCNITGTAVTRGGGGGGGNAGNGGTGGGGNGGVNGGANGGVNTGGGAGGGYNDAGGVGGSGIVILKYPDNRTITIGAGLTGSTASPSGGFKVTTITAGTGNVSWA